MAFILKAKSFSKVFNKIYTKEQAGFLEDDNVDEIMEQYYDKKSIEKYGVVAFVLK